MVKENLELMVFNLRRQVPLAGEEHQECPVSFGVHNEAIKVVNGLLQVVVFSNGKTRMANGSYQELYDSSSYIGIDPGREIIKNPRPAYITRVPRNG